MKPLAMKPLLLAFALVLGSCGHSPPTRFFTLDTTPPRPARNQGGAQTSNPLAPVQLGAVHIPPMLDRPEVVMQTGANRLALDDQDRWAAPLGEMMRRTLAQDLLARLPSGVFVLPDAPRPPGARGLVVNLLQVQASEDGHVLLQGSWTLTKPGAGAVVLARNFEFTAVEGAAGAGGQAAALSQALGQLADQIASTLVEIAP